MLSTFCFPGPEDSVTRGMRVSPFLVSSLLALAACSTPSAPVPVPAAQSIDVFTVNPVVPVGGWVALSATARMPDGSLVSAMGGRWSVDNPALARVDGPGRITALAHGLVHVRVEHLGAQGTLTLTAVPFLSGHWTGRYTVKECFGLYATRHCVNGLLPPGFSDPVALQLSQDGPVVAGTSLRTLSYIPSVQSLPLDTTLDATGRVRIVATRLLPSAQRHDYDLTLTADGRLVGTLRQFGIYDPVTQDGSGWTGTVELSRQSSPVAEVRR